jgi:hypothetical protein
LVAKHPCLCVNVRGKVIRRESLEVPLSCFLPAVKLWVTALGRQEYASLNEVLVIQPLVQHRNGGGAEGLFR